METRSDLLNALNGVEALYNQGIINQENYDLQKALLVRKIEDLGTVTIDRRFESVEIKSKKRSWSKWLILFIVGALMVGGLIFWFDGQVSDYFPGSGRQKREIEDQIRNVYFGLENGAYTSDGMRGAGTDKLPVYNQGLDDLINMGLIPVAQIFGVKVQIEAKNINVYKITDPNIAKVRYDLIVITNGDRDSTSIDMEVRKIGGTWKLDGEKWLGPNRNGEGKNQKSDKQPEGRKVQTSRKKAIMIPLLRKTGNQSAVE